MPAFDKSQTKSLKEYLYYSDIHDAKIEVLNYDREKKMVSIEAFNSINNVRINLSFREVKVMLFINYNEFGCYKTINSLTVEEDCFPFQNHTQICGDYFDDSLYLLFQMFSGDELHIVSKEVFLSI